MGRDWLLHWDSPELIHAHIVEWHSGNSSINNISHPRLKYYLPGVFSKFLRTSRSVFLKDQTSAYKAHSCAEAAAPGRELGENSGRTWATQFMEYHQGFSWKAAASNPMHPGERSVATEAGTTVPTIGSDSLRTCFSLLMEDHIHPRSYASIKVARGGPDRSCLIPDSRLGSPLLRHGQQIIRSVAWVQA